ncbi:unnamed protein product, partial [Didymodactylos carnosus]
MYHQNPSPEAIPAALLSSTAKKNRRWFSAVPLIALCGLGILGLLLVATIVLALIPVYLPKRGTVAVKTNHTSSEFYLVFTVINDRRKREIRGKRQYSDGSQASFSDQEKQQTANQ